MAFDRGHLLDLLAQNGEGQVSLIVPVLLKGAREDGRPAAAGRDVGPAVEKIKSEAIKSFATSLLNGAMTAALSGGVGPMLAAKVAIDTAKSAALAAYKDKFTQRIATLVPGGARGSNTTNDADELSQLVDMLEVDNGVVGRYLIVLDIILREHRGDAVFHGWPERGIYQFGEEGDTAPLPALLARTNFISVINFPSRGHAVDFLADEGWHALCFDCVLDGAILQVANDQQPFLVKAFRSFARWLLTAAEALAGSSFSGEDVETEVRDTGERNPAGPDEENQHENTPYSDDLGSEATSAHRASGRAAESNDALAARLYGAMAVALLRDGPVLLLQASAGSNSRLHTVPGAKEVCSFGILRAFDLDGGPLALRENPRLKFLRCQSLAGVVLQAARNPKPSADLIPTRQILSKL